MQRNTTRQYAIVPTGLIAGYVATELGVQVFIAVADPANPVEARARQAQVEAAHGWSRTLLIDRGAVETTYLDPSDDPSWY